jgi:hypothetical protein
MSEQDKDGEQPKYKITFAEGCFDEFDGTQEELDQLVAMLTEMAESGELMEKSVPLDELEDINDEVLDILPMLTAGNTRQ